jgi:hypothetical protein
LLEAVVFGARVASDIGSSLPPAIAAEAPRCVVRGPPGAAPCGESDRAVRTLGGPRGAGGGGGGAATGSAVGALFFFAVIQTG